MPWKEVKPMDEKLKFVACALEGSRTISQLCEFFGISRKTGYKWLLRYDLLGVSGLEEQNRAPKNSPHKIDLDVELQILALRKKHPAWGAPKLHAYLLRLGFEDLPAEATIGRILKRNNLVAKRTRKKQTPLRGVLTQPILPNDVWAADFKGDFKGRCGQRNYPLTISDLQSRYLLCCHGMKNTSFIDTKAGFTRTFNEYGLPAVIRTDNGVPFAGNNSLSRLCIWWMDLGIKAELIHPGCPHENGSHERMHRSLKAESIDPKRLNFHEQQVAFRKFVHLYNHERPHAGIENKVPAELYRSSPRKMPTKIETPQYPQNFKTLMVNNRATIYHAGKRWFITHALKEKRIGLELIDEGLWRLYYRSFEIAYLDEKNGQLFN